MHTILIILHVARRKFGAEPRKVALVPVVLRKLTGHKCALDRAFRVIRRKTVAFSAKVIAHVLSCSSGMDHIRESLVSEEGVLHPCFSRTGVPLRV